MLYYWYKKFLTLLGFHSFCRHFACLVDCAIFFNQAYADKSAISCMVTLLLDKSVVSVLESSDQESRQPQLARILHQARHSGVDIDTMLGFYDMWQSQSSKTAWLMLLYNVPVAVWHQNLGRYILIKCSHCKSTHGLCMHLQLCIDFNVYCTSGLYFFPSSFVAGWEKGTWKKDVVTQIDWFCQICGVWY